MLTQEGDERGRREGFGCAWLTLSVNAIFIGLLTASFVQGPFNSKEQEVWYRYYSLGFFVAGVVLPTIAMIVFRRNAKVVLPSTVWMIIVFSCFRGYAMLSGGGI